MAMDKISNKAWRMELFYKTSKELRDKNLPFLKEYGIHRLNLTNKTNGQSDFLLNSAAAIHEAIPKADICVHYSLKYNYRDGVDQSFQLLQQFLRVLEQRGANCSVLLLSGGGKKKKLDTVEALRMLKDAAEKSSVPLHVSFNPYFPDTKDAKEERRRLKDKLATGLVAGIWLQTGSDLDKLSSGLSFLKAELSPDAQTPIYGSFFLPSKKLLAQMKFRPWNGVFLSDEYLSSTEAAARITKELLGCYKQHGVIPLLETALHSTQDLRAATDLLEGV